MSTSSTLKVDPMYTTDAIGVDTFSDQTITGDKTFANIHITTNSIHTSSVPLTITSSFECYGDSYTAGSGSLSANQLWPYILSKSLFKIAVNHAVSGYYINDIARKVYTVRSIVTDNNTAIIFGGVNDLRRQYEADAANANDIVLQQGSSCLATLAVYCALKTTNKIDARSATETSTGWANTPVYNLGRSNNGAALPATSKVTMTGRFVCVAITGTNLGNMGNYYGEPFNVTITNFVLDGDGTVGTFAQTGNKPAYNMQPGIDSQYATFLFMFDTGIEGSHDITITYVTNTGDNLYIDWYGAWSSTDTFNNVLLVELPNWNYRLDLANGTPNVYATDTRRTGFNKQLKDAARMLRDQFFLPVYSVSQEGGVPTYGFLQNDGLHPNYIGEKYIATRILDTINKGQILYI